LQKEKQVTEATMRDKLKSAADSNNSLCLATSDLQTKLILAEESLHSFRNQVSDLNLDLTEASRKVTHLEHALASKISEHEYSLESFGSIKEELLNAQSVTQSLQSSLEMKELDISALAGDLQNVLDSVEKYDGCIDVLTHRDENITKQTEKVESTLATIKNQQEVSKAGVEESFKFVQSLQEKIAQLEYLIQHSEHRVRDITLSAAKEKVMLENKLRVALEEQESLSASVTECQGLVTSLRRQAESKEEETNVKLSDLNGLLDQYQEETSQLSRELDSTQQELKSTKATLQIAESQICKLTEEIETSQVSRNTMTESLGEAASKIADLETLLEKATAENAKSKSKLVLVLQELSSVCNAKNEALEAVKEMEDKQEGLEALVTDLTVKKATLESENECVVTELTLLGSKITELEVSLDNNEKSLVNATENAATLKEDKQTLEEKLVSTNQQHEEVIALYDSTSRQLQDATSQRDDFHAKLVQLTTLKEETDTKLETATTEKEVLETELESAVAEIEVMSARIAELEASSVTIGEKLASSSDKLCAFESEKKSLQEERDHLATKLEASVAEYNSKLTALEQDLLKTNDENSNLGATIQELEQQLSSARESHKETNSLIDAVQHKHSHLDEDISGLAHTNASLESQAEQSHKQIQSFSSQLSTLQESLNHAARSVEDKSKLADALRSEKNELETQVKTLMRDKEDAVSVRDKLSQALNTSETRVQEVEKELLQFRNASDENQSYTSSLLEEISAITRSRDEAVEGLKELERTHTSTLANLDRVKSEKPALEKEAEDAKHKIENMRTTISDLTEQLTAGEKKIATATEQIDIAQSQKADLEERLQLALQRHDEALTQATNTAKCLAEEK